MSLETEFDGSIGATAEGLIDRNYETVYRYAYRLAGSAQAAEDIAQETFLKAVKSYAQLREPGAERGWIMSITRHEFSRWLGREKKSGSTTQPFAETTDDGTQQAIDASDDRDCLQAALNKLALEFKQVVLMHYFENLSYAEIAEHLQIPIGTVMSRLNRAKKHLRITLEPTYAHAIPAAEIVLGPDVRLGEELPYGP